jgi:hypothetical protein
MSSLICLRKKKSSKPIWKAFSVFGRGDTASGLSQRTQVVLGKCVLYTKHRWGCLASPEARAEPLLPAQKKEEKIKSTQCGPSLISKLDAGIQGGHLQIKMNAHCATKTQKERTNSRTELHKLLDRTYY